MDFSLTGTQRAVADAIARIASNFDDAYWLARDTDGRFPQELHRALARDGWLGLAMPEVLGSKPSTGVVSSAGRRHCFTISPLIPLRILLSRLLRFQLGHR